MIEKKDWGGKSLTLTRITVCKQGCSTLIIRHKEKKLHSESGLITKNIVKKNQENVRKSKNAKNHKYLTKILKNKQAK